MWKCQGKELGKSCKSVAKELQNDYKSVKKKSNKKKRKCLESHEWLSGKEISREDITSEICIHFSVTLMFK